MERLYSLDAAARIAKGPLMPRAAIPAPLKTARALARTGVRVTVEIDGARWTIEPVDDKATKEVASGGEEAAPQQPGRWR